MRPKYPGELRLGAHRINPGSEGDGVSVETQGRHGYPGLISQCGALHSSVGGFKPGKCGGAWTVSFESSGSVTADASADVIVSRRVGGRIHDLIQPPIGEGVICQDCI